MNTDIKPQQPAEGISVTSRWPDAVSYHIECDCHGVDHAVNMWIEVNNDRETQDVEVSFYVDTWTPFWDTGFNRIKTAWNVLVKGYHRQEHTLLLNKQAALNLAKVIEHNVNELDNR